MSLSKMRLGFSDILQHTFHAFWLYQLSSSLIIFALYVTLLSF